MLSWAKVTVTVLALFFSVFTGVITVAPVANSIDLNPFLNSPIPHLSIKIDSNEDFDIEHGVVNGNGTSSNPYVLQGWDIDTSGLGYCIYIRNTTANFIIQNCSFEMIPTGSSLPHCDSIILENVTNFQISSCTFENSYCMYIKNCSVGEIFDCPHLLINVELHHCRFVTIDGNSFYTGTRGIGIILCDFCEDVVIENNVFQGAGWYSIDIDDSRNINIINNYLYKYVSGTVMPVGISLHNTSSISMERNIIIGYETGISLSQSLSCKISSNKFKSCGYAIGGELGGGGLGEFISAEIFYNTILNCGIGISFQILDVEVVIYNNNFIGNWVSVWPGPGDWETYRDLPIGGNYWDCWTGPDSDDDCIVDVPKEYEYVDVDWTIYVYDAYPLAKPYGWVEEVNIPLTAGWNLLSVPTDKPIWTLDELLHDVLDDVDLVQAWDTNSGRWLTYDRTAPYWMNSLTEVTPAMGIFIHVTNSSGSMIGLRDGPNDWPQEIALHEGWNLVGYPIRTENITLASAFSGIPWDIVQTCDQSRPYNLRTLPGTYIMQPGEGYWVHVTEDCVWTV